MSLRQGVELPLNFPASCKFSRNCCPGEDLILMRNSMTSYAGFTSYGYSTLNTQKQASRSSTASAKQDAADNSIAELSTLTHSLFSMRKSSGCVAWMRVTAAWTPISSCQTTHVTDNNHSLHGSAELL